MVCNLRRFDRLVRFVLAAMAFAGAAFLFEGVVARVVFAIVGLWCLYEAVFATCPALAKLGATDAKKPVSDQTLFSVALMTMQGVLAYEWWNAGLGKLMSGTFPMDLADTLTKFAAGNPHAWFKTFLLGTMMDKSLILGYLIEWSEVTIAVALVVSIATTLYSRSHAFTTAIRMVVAVALLGAMALNASFFFAAGWMSASTHGVNMIMFWMEAALFYVVCSQVIDRRHH